MKILSIPNRIKSVIRSSLHLENHLNQIAQTQKEQNNRTSPSTKLLLRNLWHYYQDRARMGIPLDLCDTGTRIFSQFEEDGILLAIFASIETEKKVFIDIGGADGINSNCANFALNFGWNGLFIDGNESGINYGRRFYESHPDTWLYPPKFVHAIITRENINQIIKTSGIKGTVDLLSIDIDGNDYWIWDALSVIEPRVVIIETHIELGLEPIVVPYDPNYHYPGTHPHYFGASATAMVRLGSKKGYRLVGSNFYGFNLIFIKNGIGESILPEIPVEKILSHPRNIERATLFDEIKEWEYIQV